MTTVETEHAFVVYCQDKSCQELYVLACQQNDVRPNTELLKVLPVEPNFVSMQTIDLSTNYLGPAGVHCLLDVIRANTLLMKLDLSGQSADDQTVLAVIAAVRNHSRLGHISFANNPEITHESVAPIVSLMAENKMIVNVNVRGTAIAKSVQRKLDQIGRENELLEANFFKGDFVRMKRIFSELDTTGSAQISVGALLTQIDIPQIATALQRRFASVDHGPTTDGYLDMSEFLRFTYPNNINVDMVRAHLTREDLDDERIVANWKTVLEALRRGRMEFRGLHLVRIFHRLITLEEATVLLNVAVENMWHDNHEALMKDDGKFALVPTCVVNAIQKVFGAEMKVVLDERARLWGPININPNIVRLMYNGFLAAAPRVFDLVHEGSNTLVDVPLGGLLDTVVATETTFLDTRIMEAKLRKAGIGRSIIFSFPEWLTYVCESRDIALYPVCHPIGFSVDGIAGEQDEVLPPR